MITLRFFIRALITYKGTTKSLSLDSKRGTSLSLHKFIRLFLTFTSIYSALRVRIEMRSILTRCIRAQSYLLLIINYLTSNFLLKKLNMLCGIFLMIRHRGWMVSIVNFIKLFGRFWEMILSKQLTNF